MYAPAQRHEILDERLHTLQVVVNNDPLLPPIMNLGGRNHVEISFDEFSHEYHRYIYKVEHCNADWTPSDEIFESDYLNGFNGETIEDYEKKIAKIRGTSECARCGRMVSKEMSYCPYCGEKVTVCEADAEEVRDDADTADAPADSTEEKVADTAETTAEKTEEAAE